MALTPKQQRFVDEYLVDLNATQAAIRSGYSAKTADVQGPRLLGNVKVAAALAEAKTARSERTRISSDWVLEQQQALVASALSRDTDGSVEVARKALKDIGEGIGMYVARHEHTGKDGAPLSLAPAEREAKVLSLLAAAKQRRRSA